jgi:PAS domain S-box-containing protein
MTQGPKTSRAELDRVRAALVRRESVRAELVNYTKDGVELWLEMDISPVIGARGQCTHFVAVQLDITERKRAEHAQTLLAALVASSEDAIMAKTLDGIIHIWNPGAERLFGYTAEEAVGQPMAMLFAPEDVAEEQEILTRISRGERVEHFDAIRVRKDGMPVTVAVTVSPIASKDGVILGASSIAHDITAARIADAARREQAQLLDSAQRLGGMGSWSLNLRSGQLVWAPATCSLFGVDPGSFPGTLDFFLGLMLPEDRAEYEAVCREASVSLPAYEVDYRIRRADGAVRQMYERGTVEFDAGGTPVSRVGMVTDLTERWQEKEDLRLSTALVRIAGRIARVGGWSLELPSGRVTWSEEVCNIHGVPPDFAPSVDRVVSFVLPEYREEFRARLDGCASDGVAFDIELQIMSAPHQQIWVRTIGEAIRDGAGRVVRVQGAIQDLSQLKQAERAARESAERFRLLSKAAKDVMWDWDLVEDAGWQRADLPTFQNLDYAAIGGGVTAFMRRVHADDRARVLEGIHAAVSGAGDTWADSFRYHGDDGVELPVVARGYLIRAESGQALRMVGAMTDISERLHLEAQLRQSQRLEAVGQLTGGVAHDFNNLLTVILGNAELLGDRFQGDAMNQELAQMIVTAAQRGADLTQRLLAFARKQVLDPRPVDINNLLSGIEPMLRLALGEHIDLSVTAGADLPTIVVDAAQLESAVLNLCLNSRDAMPNGGQLTIETMPVSIDESYVHQHPDASAGPHVLLAVSDTGEGIAPEHLARVFEPFFTTKETGKGSGLGLAMVYGFMKQSGGHITIYSERGQGTTVKLFLRAALATPVEERAPEPVQQAVGGHETILLVEDDEAVRRYVVTQLRSVGYTVLEAADGNAALAILHQHRDLQLLFTDIVMPGGLSGREMAELARLHRPDLRVLYTSGYTENAMVQHGRLDPGLDLLTKPYARAELLARVRRALDRPLSGAH